MAARKKVGKEPGRAATGGRKNSTSRTAAKKTPRSQLGKSAAKRPATTGTDGAGGTKRRSGAGLSAGRATVARRGSPSGAPHDVRLTAVDLIAVLAGGGVAAIVVDRRLRLQQFTAAAAMLLQVSDADVGRPIDKLSSPLLDEALTAEARRALRRTAPTETEVEGDNQQRFLQRIVPCHGENDHVVGLVISLVDVTRARSGIWTSSGLTEEAQNPGVDVTAQLSRLLDHAPDAAVVVDQRGRIVQVNPRAETFFGYEGDELVDQPLDVLIPGRFRRQHRRQVAEYFRHPYPRSMDTGQRLIAATKDGKEIVVDIQLSPMELGGEPFTLATVRDRSVQARALQAERRFATVLKASPFSIVVCQTDGTIESWNRGAERLYGYTAEEAVGRNIRMLVPPDRAQELGAYHRRCCELGTPVEFETVRLHKDGTRLDIALIYSVLTDSCGSAVGTCAIARDIGERKRLEREMAELTTMDRQRLAAYLHDSVSQQISGVSMLAASIKGKLPADSPVHPTLDNLEQAADKAKQQLGDLARGMFPVEADEHGLLAALVALAEETARMYDVRCHFQSRDKVAMEDNYTATHLYLIAREAVYNAVRHARPSEIVIRLEEVDDGVRVEVRDDGIGMEMTPDRTGGIGTKIMQHRCRLVRGTLAIDSTPGEGTIVGCTVHPRAIDGRSREN